MTTKNNKEIIIEELKKYDIRLKSEVSGRKVKIDIKHGNMGEAIATNLLSKLNKLDKDTIERYLRLKFGYRYEFKEIENRDIREAVEHLCQLIPEQGEVIEPLKDKSDWHMYSQLRFKNLPDLFDTFIDRVKLCCKQKFKTTDWVDVKIFIKRISNNHKTKT